MKKTAYLLLVLIAAMPGLARAEEPVYFPDANLKTAVEQKLGISDPTPTDMLGLTYLNASSRGITDLTGLEYAKYLKFLYLSNNQISDISALSGLEKLIELYLNTNQISDISALSGLTNLTWLVIYSNRISDISAVAGLTNLTLLSLGANQISDISALSGLTNLGRLYLDRNQLSDISALSGLTNLQDLWLNGNQISDISALSGLTNLQDLWLDDNQISDISALSGLTNLYRLILYRNQISDISALSGLTNLQILWLRYNQISDISALSGLTNLNLLFLESNPLNEDACNIYIPQIQANNPGIRIYFDSCIIALRTLTISSTNSGSVTNPGEGSFQYNHGTVVSIEATADTNYHFVSWTGTAVGAGKVANPGAASTTVTVDADYTLQANFAIDQRTLTTSSTSGGSVSTPGEGSFQYNHGTVVFIQAWRGAIYQFVNWTGTAVDAGKVANPGAASTTVTVDADYTLKANFEISGPSRPAVSTRPATNIEGTTAKLWGLIDDDGGEACQYRFKYRKEGSSTVTSWTGSVTTGQSFSQNISGLSPGSKYYFSARAKNSAGTSNWGSDNSFTTPQPGGDLIGTVRDHTTGDPIADAVVTVPGLPSQHTDGYGKFEFLNLPPGKTTVSATRSGYYPATRIVTVSSNSTTFINISMTPEDLSTEPVVVNIRGKYCGPGKHVYYLDGVSLTETFTVRVDWKAHPPGEVQWVTPKGTYKDASPGNTVSRTFDVGSDFGVDGELTVVAIAADSTQSKPTQANFTVIPPPTGMPAYLLQPDTSSNEIQYTIPGLWILDALNEGVGEGIIDGDIPVFGSNSLMMKIRPELSVKVSGSGTALARIVTKPSDLKMPVAGVPISVDKIEFSFYWTYNSTGRAWVPTGEIKIWVTGRYETPPFYIWHLPPVYWQAYIKGELKGAELALTDWQPDGSPVWDGRIPFYIGAGLQIGVGVADFISAEGYLDGGADMLVVFPSEQPLQKLTIILKGGVNVNIFLIWYWHQEVLHYEWDLIEATQESPRLMFAHPGFPRTGDFEIIERDYLGPDYAVWLPPGQRDKITNLLLFESTPPIETKPDEEQLLQLNVFGKSRPTLVADGNDLLLAWIYDDPNRTSINRTEVLFSKCQNNIWTDPIPIYDDGTADLSPQMAILPGGNALCVWGNINRELSNDADLTDMTAAMEITAAHYDGSSGLWTTQTLTDNTYLDRTPRVAAANNNTAIAVWVSNKKADILGLDPDALNEIRYSTFDGINWSEQNIAADGIGLIVKTALAYDGNRAVYTYTLDTDHNWETDTDRELYAIVYDCTNWSQPNQLTDDALIDANPQVIYEQDNLLLMWYRDANLVSCRNLDMNDVQEVLSTTGSSGAMDFRLARSPAGQISLAWTDASVNGVDIFTATYDPELYVWSKSYQLTLDRDMEKSLTAAYAGPNGLALAYNKVEIIETNGIPEPNRVDLYILRHQIKGDLAIASSDISFSVANPLPGSVVDVNAVIHNLGDVAKINVPVAFYNGDPDVNGVLIDDVQIIPGPIPAAGSAAAGVFWGIPDVNEPQEIYVVVDPEFVLEDANRANNVAFISVMAPDLTVAYITSEKIGHEMRGITVRIANFGALPAQNVSVSIRRDSINGEELAGFSISGLDPNSSYDLWHVWSITGENFDSIEIPVFVIVDESDNIYESNEDNNVNFGLVQVGTKE